MVAKDFYIILGVSKSASAKEIRQAYRRLAREYHPDVNPGDKAGEARFKEINAAHDVLSDSAKRQQYDKYGDKWEHADEIEEMQRRGGGVRFGQGGGATFDFGGRGVGGSAGGIFETLFGQGRRSARPQKGANLEQRIEVTLEEAFHGTARTLELASESACATCGGSGEIAGAVCHICEGRGRTQQTRKLEVKIPAGVDTDSRVRVAGKGQAGAGGPRGDLVLVVAMRPDERFERKGADLYVDLDLPVTDAVLGTEAEVPTMTGKVMLTVPALSPNGKVFRLAKLGMPKLKGKERGNLYARLRVKLPEKLDDKERKLFEELREAGV